MLLGVIYFKYSKGKGSKAPRGKENENPHRLYGKHNHSTRERAYPVQNRMRPLATGLYGRNWFDNQPPYGYLGDHSQGHRARMRHRLYRPAGRQNNPINLLLL